LGTGCSAKPAASSPYAPIPGSNRSAVNQVGIRLAHLTRSRPLFGACRLTAVARISHLQRGWLNREPPVVHSFSLGYCAGSLPRQCRFDAMWGSPPPPCSSVSGREVRVEPLAYLYHLLAGEASAGGEFGHGFEVAVLSTRQAPVEHARRRVTDILEAVHH